MLLYIRVQRTDVVVFYKVNFIEVYLQIVIVTLHKCTIEEQLSPLHGLKDGSGCSNLTSLVLMMTIMISIFIAEHC